LEGVIFGFRVLLMQILLSFLHPSFKHYIEFRIIWPYLVFRPASRSGLLIAIKSILRSENWTPLCENSETFAFHFSPNRQFRSNMSLTCLIGLFHLVINDGSARLDWEKTIRASGRFSNPRFTMTTV
jgi:hypothetical protein